MKVISLRHRTDDDILLELARSRGFFVGNCASDNKSIIALILDMKIIKTQRDLFKPDARYYSTEVDEELVNGKTPLICALLGYVGGDDYFWPIDYLTIPSFR